jgi:general secretion pathway protein F
MATYKYKALDASGTLRTGELAAGARQSALDQLHKRGLVPFDVIDGAAGTSGPGPITRIREALSAWGSRGRLSSRQLVSLTHALAALLGAGLTVDRALAIAASLESAPAAVQFFEDLARAVRAGASFTAALGAAGVTLPAYYMSMVEAGELGGSLPQTLTRASELLQKNLDVRDRIQSALIYPIILCCVVLGTLVILIAFVLPRFQTLFAESEAPLPWSTQVVLGLGEFTSHYWTLLICLLTTGLVAARMYGVSAVGRRHIDRWLLQSRFTFGLPASIETARMLRTLSTLLQNGVSLSAALRVSQGTMSNACLRSALERVTKSVNAGEGFATSMASVRVFPGEAVQLAHVGEETGRLHELLTEAASILETGAARTLERLLALMVPAVTVFMGLIVAGLIGSVLIGLLSINDLAF